MSAPQRVEKSKARACPSSAGFLCAWQCPRLPRNCFGRALVAIPFVVFGAIDVAARLIQLSLKTSAFAPRDCAVRFCLDLFALNRTLFALETERFAPRQFIRTYPLIDSLLLANLPVPDIRRPRLAPRRCLRARRETERQRANQHQPVQLFHLQRSSFRDVTEESLIARATTRRRRFVVEENPRRPVTQP